MNRRKCENNPRHLHPSLASKEACDAGQISWWGCKLSPRRSREKLNEHWFHTTKEEARNCDLSRVMAGMRR